MHTPYCTPATHVWHPVTPDFEVCTECRESRVRPVAEYRCSGDMPGAHVECDFTCATYDQAMDHFEATSHSVDQRCIAVDCDDPYHTATYSDLYPNEHPS